MTDLEKLEIIKKFGNKIAESVGVDDDVAADLTTDLWNIL